MELISSIIVIALFIIIIVNLLLNIKYKFLLIKKISRFGSASRAASFEKSKEEIKKDITEALHQQLNKKYPGVKKFDGYVKTNLGTMPIEDYNDIMNDIE